MYSLLSFLSVLLFALVHLLAEKSQKLSWKRQGKLLSFGGGVAISYVFVDLLPKLAKNEELIKNAFSGTLPYFEKHVYVAALLGFLLFLIAALLCGWAVSEIVAISASAVALISAFIGGGVIMNVTRHEVPKTNPHNTAVFITAALAYALLLLPLK